MTSKERMLTALLQKKPDRLPATIHQWQPYHLKNYMNNMSDIEANKFCGLDASIHVSIITGETGETWKESYTTHDVSGYSVKDYTVETPEGNLTYQEGINPMTTWISGHLIKKPEDIYLLKKYRPIPTFDKNEVSKIYDQLGDDGIIRSCLMGKQTGCWQDACELFGVENLIMATFDEPDWVHEFLEILLQQKLDYIEKNLKGAKIDLIETGGGAASNTVISPNIHEEFCMPYDKRMHDALHSLGFKIVYHTCGGMSKITDLIIKNGCDASETLSSLLIGGDIKDDETAKKVYADLFGHVALIGGMDQINILEKGTPEMIEKEVDRLFNIYGKNGGYIMSASDHFFNTSVENLKCFGAAAKNYKY